MKLLRNIICIIVGIVVGVVLTVGGLLGFGFNFLTKTTMGDVLDKSGIEGKFSDSIREVTVLEYVKNLVSAVSDFQNASIGQLEDALGYEIAEMLNETLGIDTEKLKESSLSKIPDVIMKNLTLRLSTEKFGVSLPDFPLFDDEEFMSQPISEAFGGLDNCTLDQFIEVVYDEDATVDKPASMGLVQRFGKMEISRLSSDMSGVIDDTKLSEVIKADEDSLIYDFLDLKIGELDTQMDPKIKSMKLGKFVDVEKPDTPRILKNLEDCTLDTLSDRLNNMTLSEMVDAGDAHVWAYLGDKKLSELGSAIDEMKLSDALEITENTNVILKKLADKKVNELGSEIGSVIADTSIGELITIDEENENVPLLLKSLKNTKLSQDALSDAINDFTVDDIFVDASAGVLGLVPHSTKLNALPRAIGDAVQDTNVYKLDALNVIDAGISPDTNPEIKAKIYNNTATNILTEYIGVLNHPETAQNKLATKKYKLTDNMLTQAALDDLGVRQGDTVVLTRDTAIPANEVFNFPFNILAKYDYTPDLTQPAVKETGDYTLTIGENVEVDGCGYMYVQTADVLNNNIASTDQIEVSSSHQVDAVKIEVVITGGV